MMDCCITFKVSLPTTQSARISQWWGCPEPPRGALPSSSSYASLRVFRRAIARGWRSTARRPCRGCTVVRCPPHRQSSFGCAPIWRRNSGRARKGAPPRVWYVRSSMLRCPTIRASSRKWQIGSWKTSTRRRWVRKRGIDVRKRWRDVPNPARRALPSEDRFCRPVRPRASSLH